MVCSLENPNMTPSAISVWTLWLTSLHTSQFLALWAIAPSLLKGLLSPIRWVRYQQCWLCSVY